MARQPREAPRRLAFSWPWVRVGCLQERARRAVGLALNRTWRWVLLLVGVCVQIHGTLLGFYLEGSAFCSGLPRAFGNATRTRPEKWPQKVRPNFFRGGEGAHKGERFARWHLFFLGRFLGRFLGPFLGHASGGREQPRSAARGWSPQGLHAAPRALATGLRGPRREASGKLSRMPRERVTRLSRPGRDLVGQPGIEAPILVGGVARTPRGARGREVWEQMRGRPRAQRPPSRNQYPLGALKHRLESVGISGQWGPWAKRSVRSNIAVMKKMSLANGFLGLSLGVGAP